ncbi:HET-domain-containing protein, partial [Setomelanomma holmii]
MPERPSIVSNNAKKTLKLRENVAEMLECLQQATSIRRLWIDAICINQKDDREKSFQVQQMGNIYAGATQVIIYI